MAIQAYYRQGATSGAGQDTGGLILGPVAVGQTYAACGLITDGSARQWVYNFAGSAWALAGSFAPTPFAPLAMPAAVVTPTSPPTVYTVTAVTPDPFGNPSSGAAPGDTVTFSTIGTINASNMNQFSRVS